MKYGTAGSGQSWFGLAATVFLFIFFSPMMNHHCIHCHEGSSDPHGCDKSLVIVHNAAGEVGRKEESAMKKKVK